MTETSAVLNESARAHDDPRQHHLVEMQVRTVAIGDTHERWQVRIWCCCGWSAQASTSTPDEPYARDATARAVALWWEVHQSPMWCVEPLTYAEAERYLPRGLGKALVKFRALDLAHGIRWCREEAAGSEPSYEGLT